MVARWAVLLPHQGRGLESGPGSKGRVSVIGLDLQPQGVATRKIICVVQVYWSFHMTQCGFPTMCGCGLCLQPSSQRSQLHQ